jgi:ubiquinone/menaquinone biosynthesis C-methylase UbiE
MNNDPTDRKAQTRTQFNTIATDYEAGPGCFAHFGQRLVAAANIESGQRLLDVASGRGAVLFPCAEQIGETGDAVGIDLADEMANATNEEAARRGFAARVQVMDAENLDFPDEAFDRVLCGFGVMFFPDQDRALGEFRRVLKPDGRLAMSTWRITQCSELEAVMDELGMRRPKPPSWITESADLSDCWRVRVSLTYVWTRMSNRSATRMRTNTGDKPGERGCGARWIRWMPLICDIAILKARPPHFHSTAFGRRPQHVQHMQQIASEILRKNPDHNSSRPCDLALSDPSKMLPEAISTAFGPRRRR